MLLKLGSSSLLVVKDYEFLLLSHDMIPCIRVWVFLQEIGNCSLKVLLNDQVECERRNLYSCLALKLSGVVDVVRGLTLPLIGV